MPDKHHLLTLPMELRCHIYSFIYLEHRIVKFLRPKYHYTKTALFKTCRQINQETLEYYYGRNTFSLPLQQKFAVSDWRYLPRHFNLVKMLHLEAEKFFWKFSRNSAKTSQHVNKCQRRLENYLDAIFWVNQGMLAPNLKTLTFADSMRISYEPCYWERSIETSKERLERYFQVFEKLQIDVGRVVIEIDEGLSNDERICLIYN